MTKINITPYDKTSLYRLVEYSDYKAGQIIEHQPILEDGSPDSSRMPIFQARTFLNGNPVQLEIEGAHTFLEAMDLFPQALQDLIDKAESEARQAQIARAGEINGRPFGRIIQNEIKRKN